MFVTPHFVYVHVPKTGGNFVRNFARRHFEIVWDSEQPGRKNQHVAYETLPEEYGQLPAISFVRNPWAFYVSQWAWILEHGKESRMAQAARRGFKDFIRTGMSRQRRGYAYLFAQITRGTEVGRYEQLPEELLAFFERHQVPTTPELARDLVSSPRINASEHGTYQQYYDDETRDLVAEDCREIIATYGYTFE